MKAQEREELLEAMDVVLRTEHNIMKHGGPGTPAEITICTMAMRFRDSGWVWRPFETPTVVKQ